MFKRILRPFIDEIKEHVSHETQKHAPTQRDFIDDDYASLVKEALMITDLNQKDVDQMDVRDRDEMVKSANTINREPALRYVLDALKAEQMREMTTKGHHRDHYIAGRAVIMAYENVLMAIERLSMKFEESNYVDPVDINDSI